MSRLPHVVFGPEIWSLQRDGGISRYFQQLINELSKVGASGKILTSTPNNDRINDLNLHEFELLKVPSNSNKYKDLPNYLSRDSGRNILHPTYYSRNLLGLQEKKLKVVITVFDMISEIFPERKPQFRRFIDEKRISVDRADHILSISQQTKNDLIRFYGVPEEKITVTHLGTNLHKIPRSDFVTPPRNSYILYIGKRGGYKNFKNFVAAFSQSKQLKSNFSIIAIGGESFNSEENELFLKLGIQEKIFQINSNDSQLAMYYRRAACLVYPSLYEGFGLPPIEAMSLNCPVIASNQGSIPEICKTAAQYFDPNSIDSIQQTIEVTLQNEELLDEMRRNGVILATNFTWEKTGAITLSAYSKVLNT